MMEWILSRWREKGNDGLEYRLLFYDISDLSIVGTTQDLGPSVSLELDEIAARLISHDRAFSATFKFRGVRIFLRPFSGRRRNDLQDFWPRFEF